MITEAIIVLRPNSTFCITNNDYSTLKWNDPNTNPPSLEEVDSKIAELQSAEPMKMLRSKRDELIATTDWWVLPDRTPTQAQLDYRQALRDLPANSPNVDFDENGNLTGVTWPVKPE